MKNEDVLTFIPILLTGFLLGCALMTILCTYRPDKMEKENKELKIENHKLEQKLLKLYDEQAKLTKKIAEMNRIGG